MSGSVTRALKQLLAREMWKEKWDNYIKSTLLPIHKTPEEYEKWLNHTKRGKLHKEALERIDKEIHQEIDEFFNLTKHSF